MTHQNNLKVIVFVGEDTEKAVEYLTEKHFPKVAGQDIVQQIEHLVGAGQHRIITNAISTIDDYKELAHEFPGELNLVTVGDVSKDLASLAHHHITYDSKIIDELLETLDFKL